MSQLKLRHHGASQCDVGEWLKARRLVSETKLSLLTSNILDICQCLGGINECLLLLLNNRSLLTTIQLMQLNDILTEINQKDKTNKNAKSSMDIDNNNDNNIDDDNSIDSVKLINIPSQCIKHITTFLTIPEVSILNNVCSIFAIIGSNEVKKTNSYFINGHNLIIQHQNQMNKQHLTDVIDIGFDHFLVQIRTFKDESLLNLFQTMAQNTNIPLQYLLIYSYTVRNNGTMRANRKICLDFNESTNDRNDYYHQDMIISHNIPTTPHLRIKHVTSIHEFIGNVKPKYRKFLLLNTRKIDDIDNLDDNGYNVEQEPILICLKYFDLITQTLYFADWIRIYNKNTTIRDLAKFIENRLLCNNNNSYNEKYYFLECIKYLERMIKSENNINMKENHFMLFEECDSSQGHIFCLDYNKSIYHEFRDGDIFVFQLNPYHCYFRSHTIQFMIQSSFHQSHTSIFKTFNDFMISMSQ